MNNKLSLTLLPIALLAFVALPFAQQRVTKKAPEFEKIHAEIGRAYAAGEFGHAVKQGKELLVVLQSKWKGQILAAFPAAPEGFEIVPQKKEDPRAAGVMAAMSGAIGTVIEQKYKAGRRTITVQVQADSPLIQMFSMWVANPSMLGEDAELIKYENGLNAVLKKEGRGYSMQMVPGVSLVEAKGDATDDELLKLLSQAAVDKPNGVPGA